MPYQQEMKVRHARKRLDACRHREARVACLYGQRVRDTERAEEKWRIERRRFEETVLGSMEVDA